ncbi:hypothetical protein [Synechococcus sp. CBW1006]|uniref:hypothetical protein n=1 Tax=Synechococcus sp. CBW1006 TaxID=1353138 RepID=UPI0018CF0F66|nr:hypothetical protein [Synechococcus sp. CBW1006]QPN67533.1 hypothetical protein H8F26_04925 [Synechococcus sp. CBW1006]
MSANKKRLSEQRIEYYGKCTFAKDAPGDTIAQDFYERLKTFRANSTSDRLVVSDEDLCHNRNDIFYTLVCNYSNEFNIKIVCYIREVVSYCISFYSFAAIWLCNRDSSPAFRNFVEYLDRQKAYIATYDLLTKLAKVLPNEDVIVRPFNFSQFREKKIDNDFFDILNVDATLFQSVEVQNISPTLKQAEKIYYVLSITSNRHVRVRARDLILQIRDECGPSITKDELDAVYERYRDYEMKIQRAFFNRGNEEQRYGRTYARWIQKIDGQEERVLNASEKHRILAAASLCVV